VAAAVPEIMRCSQSTRGAGGARRRLHMEVTEERCVADGAADALGASERPGELTV